MTLDGLREQIHEYLRFSLPDTPPPFVIHHIKEEQGYRRVSLQYPGQEGDTIPAFLLLPEGGGPFAAVLVHHQHHGQRHLGKSEVSGLAGDPLQAFGPALARQGMAVLAPDSICFEDRRRNRRGIEADQAADMEHHYNEMCYRLLQGDTLMRKVLDDSAQGISLLRSHPLVDPERIGILGHSYGGNTVLFHGALDERIRFACASGTACSYQFKLDHQIGIEMAEVIPAFLTHFDIPDLAACFAPRQVLIVSATDDPHSQDAVWVVESAREKCVALGAADNIEHRRYNGNHDLTQERFNDIVDWMVRAA